MSSIDTLAKDVNKILLKYANAVVDNVNDITKEITKKGVEAVKSSARGAVGGTGTYPAGFTSRFETGRFSAQGTIYNAVVPGLPHLLEFGHAMRNGGRVAGRPHLKPVEEELIKQYEEQVKEAL